jgi:hypothetical protein
MFKQVVIIEVARTTFFTTLLLASLLGGRAKTARRGRFGTCERRERPLRA